mgnify:CR=1 FL=1
MLYCVYVTNSTMWGERSVDSSWDLVEAETQEELDNEIWEMREQANTKCPEYGYECEGCGREYTCEDKASECCYGEYSEWDEEESEVVERETDFRCVPYDPAKHAFMEGFEDQRPEYFTYLNEAKINRAHENALYIEKRISDAKKNLLLAQEELTNAIQATKESL